MRLAQPFWLILLAFAALPLVRERLRGRTAWPSLAPFGGGGAGASPWVWVAWLPAALQGLAIAATAVALARPQAIGGVVRIASQGVAIMVAMDQSSSMSTVDFPADLDSRRISRLEAARETFARFVAGRRDDLIGLTAFANYPDLACPPTLDHRFLLEAAAAVRPARPGDDGTNIGDALAWSLEALRRAAPAKKVLILLTDGNDAPAVPNPLNPDRAAALARDLGVTLHTIAVGREGGVVHGLDKAGRPVLAEREGPNVELLERLAATTGGRSFRANDADALDAVFRTIDSLEKSRIRDEVRTRYDERFAPWAAAAVGLLTLDRLLTCGRLRRLP
ncbi:VWA domain-containing protein [Paludisphaera mucosa]|uniref:VWA domain-containing protein n=1 Tax=Paludisphaera mucosa TaxID=3030827 RepID=A0ABT6FC18_9BACT|nr:VWA domain-containing protein [Paludisphaera mucosa]MDG3005087.1 VWA domain-containing protein [Paludisphaera mucosa]